MQSGPIGEFRLSVAGVIAQDEPNLTSAVLQTQSCDWLGCVDEARDHGIELVFVEEIDASQCLFEDIRMSAEAVRDWCFNVDWEFGEHEWQEADRGEKATWRKFADIWVGITHTDLENAMPVL